MSLFLSLTLLIFPLSTMASDSSSKDFAALVFGIFVFITLLITYFASKKNFNKSNYYAAGGKISGLQNGLAIAGDYGFQYTIQELGTAVELQLNLPILIWDNHKLKAIEDSMIAAQISPNSVQALNPDFCKLAESYGARGYYMETLLENDSTSEVELFAIFSEVFKSFP